jgi:guanylate kinase
MEKKSEKIILLGASGSGKDHLMMKLVEKGLKGCLKCTTRPKRTNEEQGVTYNFITEKEFIKSINENRFISYQTFSVLPDGRDPETWHYGITFEDFNESQIFIMTPGELKNISPEIRKGCFVVYLDIDRSIRESRISGRNDFNDSVKRRLDADEIDFKDFNDYDLKITDPEFSSDVVYDLMN